MKILAILFGLAAMTTLYSIETKRISDEIHAEAYEAADYVRTDLQYAIDQERERLDDLEIRAITRW